MPHGFSLLSFSPFSMWNVDHLILIPDSRIVCLLLGLLISKLFGGSFVKVLLNAHSPLLFLAKGWNHALEMSGRKDDHWALYAKSYLDRTRLALSSKAELYHQLLQPSAEYLGALLGVDHWAVCIYSRNSITRLNLNSSSLELTLQVNVFTEEIIRGGSAASLSALLNRLDPVLRKEAHLGR